MKACPKEKRGFTLLEVILSLAIFLLLITAAFSVVGASTELMAEVSEAQNDSALKFGFIETCRVAFESTTRNSSLRFFHFPRGSDREDTYLVFGNSPSAFDVGFDNRYEITHTVLATEVLPDGFLRARVYYMSTNEYEAAAREEFTQLNSPHVDLLPRIRQLDWQFFNERSQRWENDMDIPFPNSLVRIIFDPDGASSPLETVFFHLAETE